MPDQPANPTPQPLARASCAGTLLALAYDARRGCAYVGGSEGAVHVLDVNATEWQLRRKLEAPRYVGALGLLDSGAIDAKLIVARYDGSLTWHRAHDGKLLHRVDQAHHGWIRDLKLLDDGTQFITVGDDMQVKRWDARDGRLLQTLTTHAIETPQGYVSALYTLDVTADGSLCASADRTGEIRLTDLRHNKPRRDWRTGEFYTFDPEKRDRSIGGVRRVRFSPDGQRLAISGIGQVTNVDGFVGPCRVEVWDCPSGQRVAVLQDSHQAVLNDLLWTADGTRLIAAGGGDGGGVIVIWKIGDEKPQRKIKFNGHTQRLTWIRPDEQLLAVGFEGVQLWDVSDSNLNASTITAKAS